MKSYTLRIGSNQDTTMPIKHNFDSIHLALNFYNNLLFKKKNLYFLLVEEDSADIEKMTVDIVGVKLTGQNNFVLI